MLAASWRSSQPCARANLRLLPSARLGGEGPAPRAARGRCGRPRVSLHPRAAPVLLPSSSGSSPNTASLAGPGNALWVPVSCPTRDAGREVSALPRNLAAPRRARKHRGCRTLASEPLLGLLPAPKSSRNASGVGSWWEGEGKDGNRCQDPAPGGPNTRTRIWQPVDVEDTRGPRLTDSPGQLRLGQMPCVPSAVGSRTTPGLWSTPETRTEAGSPAAVSCRAATAPKPPQRGRCAALGRQGREREQWPQRWPPAGLAACVRNPAQGRNEGRGLPFAQHAGEGSASWILHGESQGKAAWDTARSGSSLQLLQIPRSSPGELQGEAQRRGGSAQPLPKRTSPAPGSRGNSPC